MKKRGSALGSSSSTDDARNVPPEGSERHVIGRLGKPNGLEGYLGIYIEQSDLVYLEPGSVVHLADDPYTIRAVRRGKKGYQVAFAEITDRDGAEAVRGSEVRVGERRELADNEFWPEDLVGLEVRPGGGTVMGVIHGPSQARLLVERAGEQFEVPFVDELVPHVDLDAGFLELNEIEGLSPRSDPR